MTIHQIVENSTIEQAAQHLQAMKRWQPFRFSGRWFLAQLGNDVGCYRTLKSAERNATKCGADTIAIFDV